MLGDRAHQFLLEGGIRITHFIAMVIIGLYGNDLAIFVCLRAFQTGLGRDDVVERVADDQHRFISEFAAVLTGIIGFEFREPLRGQLQSLMQDIAVRGCGFLHRVPCALTAHIVDHGIAGSCRSNQRQRLIIEAAAALVGHGHRDAATHAARVESDPVGVDVVMSAHIVNPAQQILPHGRKRIAMRLGAVFLRGGIRVKIHAYGRDAAARQPFGKFPGTAAVAIAGKAVTHGDQLPSYSLGKTASASV